MKEAAADRNTRLQQIHSLVLDHESALGQPILDFLKNHRYVHLIGKTHTRDGDRAPTIAFKPTRQTSREVSTKMQDQNIGCESGDFYATRLISDLGIDPEDGVVRISLVHYSTPTEVERILEALDQALDA